MRLISVILCLFISGCFVVSAYAARPEMTVQISDTRDEAGKFSSWQTIVVTWDETALTALPDHKPYSHKFTQTWAVPDDAIAIYWKFSFRRTKQGEYALRVCFGTPVADTLWSDIGVIIVLKPKGPKAL